MSLSSEEQIKEKYGNVSLESAPVDPNNPTFDSLLGALKEVFSGNSSMDVLVKYHKGLSKQLEDSKKALENIETEEVDGVSEEYKKTAKEQRDISLGALTITRSTLDLLKVYIDHPSRENMANCIDSLLTTQRIMKGVHDMLNETIKQAIEEFKEEEFEESS
ncbi:MAG TPA: hypothetical protein PL110_06255 [Candidatus Eremiobacteraeota bacterium]|nr:MAG: hypothetical protein BWY64_02318 [bacterium ADurb.Bin363]HPZ07695.1 hypothetical protein [Candidatus Eremiobacteraeota bacterium]